MKKMPRIVISASHKSSGKTVVTVGLCAALVDRGLKVQPFKKGPDYIDPMWHSAAAGTVCRNLDYFMFGWDEIKKHFTRYAQSADISIIEGNKGLHDAVEVDGNGSTANLARHLNAPVILVIDAGRITRGVAPLIIGYKAFEPDINIAGVILNKVASGRQEKKLRDVIDRYCDIPLLGCIRKSVEMEVMERHLGLIPIKEDMGLYPAIRTIQRQVSQSVDLDKIMEIGNSADEMNLLETVEEAMPKPKVKLGVMLDQSFTFYYPENLEALQKAGAQLVPINALRNTRLPKDIDGLYIGGGFPETMMEKLEKNSSLRIDILLSIENGLPVHAECGGLMYLAKTISWKNRKCKMVGALDCDIIIRKKPKGHGYVKLSATGKSPLFAEGTEIRAHEFHYGDVINLRHSDFAYKVDRGTGIDGRNDGIVYKNVTASFAHLHHLGCRKWAASFVEYLNKIGYSKTGRPLAGLKRKEKSGKNNF